MLSIILIEYNSLDEIANCLSSLRECVQDECEIIVSSNSLYTLDNREKVRARFPGVKWSFNERNGGFAYGMNEGLKVAKGDVLIMMNPDVQLKSSLQPMIDYLQSHAEVGIIAPKILDKEGIIQDSFRSFITPWGFVLRHVGRMKDNGQLHVKDYNRPVHSDWVIGAFMMCRRDFYEKVGGLSDDYFMYCEDMDWCKRARLAGYDVVYFPETTIEYKGTRAARQSWKYTKIFLNSLFTYWKKYGIK